MGGEARGEGKENIGTSSEMKRGGGVSENGG